MQMVLSLKKVHTSHSGVRRQRGAVRPQQAPPGLASALPRARARATSSRTRMEGIGPVTECSYVNTLFCKFVMMRCPMGDAAIVLNEF